MGLLCEKGNFYLIRSRFHLEAGSSGVSVCFSNVGFGGRKEANDDGGGNSSADYGAREEGGRGLLVNPANLLEEVARIENFGETLGMLL